MRGSTLIEVLVALLLLSIGGLGFIALQLKTVSTVNDAFNRTQALIIAQDVIERIRANPRGWPQHYGVGRWDGSGASAAQKCTFSKIPNSKLTACYLAKDMANYDKSGIALSASASLPQGAVVVKASCANASDVACVVVGWGDALADGKSDCDGLAWVLDDTLQGGCIVVEFKPYSHG